MPSRPRVNREIDTHPSAPAPLPKAARGILLAAVLSCALWVGTVIWVFLPR